MSSYGSSKRRRPNPGKSAEEVLKPAAAVSSIGGAASAAGATAIASDSLARGNYQQLSIAEEPASALAGTTKAGTSVAVSIKPDSGAGSGGADKKSSAGDSGDAIAGGGDIKQPKGDGKVVSDVPGRWFNRSDPQHIWAMLTDSKINYLFVFLPLAYLSAIFSWGDAVVFIFNFLAMIPLAALLGNATEEVAARTNDIIGGFMNCTLGNIMEVIISITALRKGYLRVVQTSLLGSVFSNMLLVLGCCFLLGGITTPAVDKQQKFNRIGATTFSSLLLIACLGLVSPASFINNVSPRPTKDDLLMLSRIGALILGSVYVLYLVFQMKTHSHLFDADEEEEDGADGEGGDGEGGVTMSLAAGVVLLAAISVSVVICSELLVDSIGGAIETLGLNQVFIGVILLPIIGNAAEHVSAVSVAMKDKMDLALGVAIGSSIQIALFVIPLVTLVGWMIDQPLTLDFHTFETVVLLMSVLITNVVISSGQANWLAGAMLLAAYVIIAIAFFFHPDTPLATS